MCSQSCGVNGASCGANGASCRGNGASYGVNGVLLLPACPTPLWNLCKPSHRLDTMSIVIFCIGVVDAVDMAWKMDRGNCADYLKNS